jgi:hypothetical protein
LHTHARPPPPLKDRGPYARKEGDILISTNTIEGYFSILKRGINGVYHHVSKKHSQRYLSEFDFRYNARDITGGERAARGVKGFAGKMLTYRDSSSKPERLGSPGN